MQPKNLTWRNFYDKDPFAGFDLNSYSFDLQGWGANHRLFHILIEEVRPRVVVEVGSWKGRSAIRMAKILKRKHIPGVILCVDTWLGSFEHFTGIAEPRDEAKLERRNGYPILFYQLLANILHAGYQEYIIPIALPSSIAAQLLEVNMIAPDIVYIDGSHAEEDVQIDIRKYWSLLQKDGILFGDDYFSQFPGVVKAVDRFTAKNQLNLFIDNGKWIIPRNQMRPWHKILGKK